MRTILLITTLITCILAAGRPHLGQLGEQVTLEISVEKAKLLTRELISGDKEIWNLDGPDKGFWVDKNGKKIATSNYEFKAPGTLIIKKLTASDAGLYDYEPLVAPPPPPPGVHVDPGLRGIQLLIAP